MTIAEHHRLTLPDVFTLHIQRAGDLDWELSIAVNRGEMTEDGIHMMSILVRAQRWGRTKLLRRPKLLSFAELRYEVSEVETMLVDELHSMDREALQGEVLAREFFFRNRVRIDKLIELDDRIVTGDCRCDDCTSSFGPIPTAIGWSMDRWEPGWLIEMTPPTSDSLGSR